MMLTYSNFEELTSMAKWLSSEALHKVIFTEVCQHGDKWKNNLVFCVLKHERVKSAGSLAQETWQSCSMHVLT